MTDQRSWIVLAGVAAVAGCASPPPSKAAVVESSAPATPAPTFPPLGPSLVAASNELAEALRAPEPLRLQRVARARHAIESIVGRPAALVGPGKLAHGVCALVPTILAVGGAGSTTSTPSGHFVGLGDELFRFDPELKKIALATPVPDTEDSPLDLARFVWVEGAPRRLVDVETNAIIARADAESVVFRSRSGRLRLIGVVDGATELRSLPSGKLLFRETGVSPFVDDVAGVAGTLDLAYGQPSGPSLTVHDAEDGRQLRHFANVPMSYNFPTRVTVAPDGRTFAINAVASVAWLELKGRRVGRNLTDGSSFEAYAEGPYFTGDGKRACARLLGAPVVLPADIQPNDHVFCAFWQRTALHEEAVIVTVKPDPPWQILRGRAVVVGNFPRTLGGSAATADGLRAAVVETAKPVESWSGEARLRLVDVRTGATLRTWPLAERGLIDLEPRFVDGDSALELEPGGERFVIAEGASAPSPVVPKGNAECGSVVGWNPEREPTCAIGPVVGPAALCEGLSLQSRQ